MSEQDLLAILRRARATLSDSSHFSRRHFAEDATGRWIPVGSSQAVRFNLEGAIVHAAGSDARDALPAIFEVFAIASPELSQRLKHRACAPFEHAEALELLDRGIAHMAVATNRLRSGTHRRAVAPEELAQAVTKIHRG